jgi:D-ribose pyranase
MRGLSKEEDIKKKGILNSELNALIGRLGHGDHFIVSDAGFAIPRGLKRIDLAIEKDSPSILRILDLLNEELYIEKVGIAEEMREYNPKLFDRIMKLYSNIMIEFETVPYKMISGEIAKTAKAIVRTGSFEPFGEIVIYPAVNAEEWFLRDGVKIPENYKKRLGNI